jgi:predicted nucleic acid-binding Zn ribbon protein
MLTTKKCPECGSVITGRSDKRFCSDGCRNVLHNRERQQQVASIRSVNHILIRNRRILLAAVESSKQRVPLAYLRAKGFNFHFFTHQVKSASGETVTFCYDVGYRQESSNLLALLKEDESQVIRKQV